MERSARRGDFREKRLKAFLGERGNVGGFDGGQLLLSLPTITRPTMPRPTCGVHL